MQIFRWRCLFIEATRKTNMAQVWMAVKNLKLFLLHPGFRE
jgi:hypothetical protein